MLARCWSGPLGFIFPFLLLAAPSFSADESSKLPSSLEDQQRAVQEVFASDRLSYWQRRLKLSDWSITVKVCRGSELRRETVGNVHWDPEKKTAVIRVLDASDYKLQFSDVLRDVENTVVHELVHLELAYLPRTESSASPEEQAVNRLTEALLKLHRNE